MPDTRDLLVDRHRSLAAARKRAAKASRSLQHDTARLYARMQQARKNDDRASDDFLHKVRSGVIVVPPNTTPPWPPRQIDRFDADNLAAMTQLLWRWRLEKKRQLWRNIPYLVRVRSDYLEELLSGLCGYDREERNLKTMLD